MKYKVSCLRTHYNTPMASPPRLKPGESWCTVQHVITWAIQTLYLTYKMLAKLTGLSASVAVTWVRKTWLLIFCVKAISHGLFINSGEKLFRMMLTVTNPLTTAFLGLTGSLSRRETSNWNIIPYNVVLLYQLKIFNRTLNYW